MQCTKTHKTHSFLSAVSPLHCGNEYATDDFLLDCFQLCCSTSMIMVAHIFLIRTYFSCT